MRDCEIAQAGQAPRNGADWGPGARYRRLELYARSFAPTVTYQEAFSWIFGPRVIAGSFSLAVARRSAS